MAYDNYGVWTLTILGCYYSHSRRLFLKRSVVSNITEDKLYVGSVLNVNSRQLTLTSYGDKLVFILYLPLFTLVIGP